ncbi:sugar ABC transporter substrate-binding protein [Cellulomonas sp. KRMCY2]|uniref:sugar ABC transporter substrate-binding protein n=1 Tax=Cellulomonas sp. KRMCY2 TaxID=1304865 RepID=UPI00045E5C4F|nr:sugar ABC transporter substrate-binding protein [Cellulomonas sp. KRMCY2]
MRTLNRRTAVGSLVAVLALATTACSSGGADTADPGTSSTESSATSGSPAASAPQLHMGIAVANASLNFANEMADGATMAATNDGNVDFQVVGPPDTDGPAEVQLFQNLVTTATDGVILENLNPPLFTRPAADAIAAGVPVIALDTSPTDGSDVTFYVGNDNYDLGVQMAHEMLKNLDADPQGEVVIGVPNPAAPVLANRAQGIMDTLAAEAPGITVFGPYETYSEPTKNYGAWEAQVHAHPDALAFLGVGDADSYDLAKLKTEQNGTWLTAGFDVDGKTLQAVKDGQNFMTMDPEHFLKGYIASALLIDSVRNGTELPSGWFVSPGLVVTADNVDEVITRETTPQAAYDWYKPQIDALLGDVEASMKPLGEAR